MSKLFCVESPREQRPLRFVKFQGAGNDFLLIDDRALTFRHDIASLCHRKFGIGADGLILLQPDSTADFRMRIFNCDGREAESCGNGLRCLMQFLLHLGFPQKSYQIAAGSRILSADFVGSNIRIDLGKPDSIQDHFLAGKTVHFLNTGVPHAVLFVPDVQAIDLPREGAHFRRHPAFQPHGTNVNFATLQPDRSLRVRTFERGLEGESLACGTGAAAVAFIAAQKYQLPNPIQISFPGGTLQMEVIDGAIKMLGPAVKVFEGMIS